MVECWEDLGGRGQAGVQATTATHHRVTAGNCLWRRHQPLAIYLSVFHIDCPCIKSVCVCLGGWMVPSETGWQLWKVSALAQPEPLFYCAKKVDRAREYECLTGIRLCLLQGFQVTVSSWHQGQQQTGKCLVYYVDFISITMMPTTTLLWRFL